MTQTLQRFFMAHYLRTCYAVETFHASSIRSKPPNIGHPTLSSPWLCASIRELRAGNKSTETRKTHLYG